METNQILLIVIVVLISIIVIIGIYFLVLYLMNKNREKKIDNIFDPTRLVEEESLMNVMDEKRNVEFKKNEEKFVNNSEEVKIIASGLTQEQKTNPFNVDMTMHKKDSTPIEIKDPNNKNKFIQ